MRTLYLSTKDPYIIGKNGESQRTALRVDVDEWKTEYPDGTGVLLFVRPNKVTYPLETALVTHEGKYYLETIVTSNETKLPGWVVLTAQWYDGETLVHGRTYSGKVLTSNGTNVTDGVQETTPTWVAELLAGIKAIDETTQTVNEAYADVQEALGEISGAKAAAMEAKGYKNEAGENATLARTYAETAEEYKGAAAASAAAAAESAESAMAETPTGYSSLVGSVASVYSASSAYNVGDYVLKDSTLYRCKTAISNEGEEWTSGHWTQVKIGTELKSALRANSTYINSSNYASYFSDANDAPVNTIYTFIGTVTSAMVDHLPRYGVNSLLMTFAGIVDGTNVRMQLFATGSATYIRKRSYSGTWYTWEKLTTEGDIDNILYGGYITTTDYSSYFTDANNAPFNKVYAIQGAMDESMIANLPVYHLNQMTLLTLNGRNPSDGNGNMNVAQICIVGSGGAIYVRGSDFTRSVWSDWEKIATEKIYHVGPDREYTSFTACMYALRNDSNPKIIYVDGGEYDIAQEYADAEIPVIAPDGDYNNDYTNYNVWIPKNAHVIGMGNVVLKYSPLASEVTEAQSKTVSPLNIHYTCTVENITVECRNGRYCAHLDGQGSENYSDTVVCLKNVHFIKHVNDEDRGWNIAVGIGLDRRQSLSFEECVFESDYPSAANFYAHNRNKVGDDYIKEADSSRITVVNSIIINNGEASEATDIVRLESRATTYQQKCPAKFINCHIAGTVHLRKGTGSPKNCFDLTLLKCGTPEVTVDSMVNPYPVKVYG